MACATFRDLAVWRKAHAYVLQVYRLAAGFPKFELFALGSQFRRAAVSIPANVAEGFKKKSKADKARFYNIAQGSLEECRYYMILVQDLGYGNCDKLMEDLDEISRMLDAYIRVMMNPR